MCSFDHHNLGKDIAAKKRVQHRATRLILGRARIGYEERLKKTGIYTLERRRLRGDMMEMFKIMKGTNNLTYSRADSDMTRDIEHSLKGKKRRDKMGVK